MTIVAVTGASGYIASNLVAALLEKGYTVHGTVRSLQDKAKVAHLQAMLNPANNNNNNNATNGPQLKLFEADLLKEGSFAECFKDCEIIFHTASPFQLTIEDPTRDLLEPAVNGTKNVVREALRTPTVKKIVLTSSVAAIRGARAPGHIYTEADWNETANIKDTPYPLSKTQAEKTAWDMVQNSELNPRSVKLVTINPSFVIGPSRGVHADSESVKLFRDILNGVYKDSGLPPRSFGTVDVRDVVDAHIAAAELDSANGRNIISSIASTNTLQWCEALLQHPVYSKYPIPNFMSGQPAPTGITIDNSKARRELLGGRELIHYSKSVVDMADRLVELGVVAHAQPPQ